MNESSPGKKGTSPNGGFWGGVIVTHNSALPREYLPGDSSTWERFHVGRVSYYSFHKHAPRFLCGPISGFRRVYKLMRRFDLEERGNRHILMLLN
jgi:hypothetical protein